MVGSSFYQEPEQFRTIFICGPTGSGKSALAIKIAQKVNGSVINADSMQVYQGLEILTACPSSSDKDLVPHKLYNFVDPNQKHSVGIWLSHALKALEEVRQSGRVPIFVGGTGLYFRALLDGLAPIPQISNDIRLDSQNLFETIGRKAFCARLDELDPIGLRQVGKNDTQRLLRLYEVALATGKTLREWHALGSEKRLNGLGEVIKFILSPDRNELYCSINKRVEKMVSVGLLEELQLFIARGVSPTSPALKAVGVREFSDYLDGRMQLEDAILSSQVRTRRYAKRQLTWFRNQMSSAQWLRGFGDSVVKIAINSMNQRNQVDQILSKD